MLPYADIGEAEAALGRPLSFAETLWFRHTANVSDQMLYCYNLIFLFTAFTVLPLPTVLLDVFKVDKFKLQKGVHTSFKDALRCYKQVMTTFIFVVGFLQVSSSFLVQKLGLFRTSLPLPSTAEFLSQIIVYFLIEDFGNYWIHRWLHTPGLYERIHYQHHEFEAPMSFAAPYAHWAEILVLGIPSFVGPVLAPGHMVTIWAWIFLRNVEALDTHSGYEFPWNPTKFIPFYGGAKYHDYHHYVGGQSQSNFASVFTFCDYLYGTDRGYRAMLKAEAKLSKQSVD